MLSRSLPRPSLLAVIAAVSIAVLVMMIVRPGEPATRLISHWQPQPMVTQPDMPDARAAAPPASITGAVVPVDAFNLHVDDGLYPDERQPLADDMQQALAYVAARFGSHPASPFTAAVMHDGACGLHGLAYTDARTVQVFTCPGISRQRAVAIMAHEMVHQLEQDRYGPAHLHADLLLAEGMATWGAGKYWLGSQPDFRSYVRAQRQNGLYYPLATHYNGLGVAGMNALYYEWASFVDFLITTYGRDKFDHVYVTGHSAPGSADYAGVYGKGLDALEHEWVAWLGS
jgi:hypothetical protein